MSMGEKADYTNLERLQGKAQLGDDDLHATANYLCEHSFCPTPYECVDTSVSCAKCIARWLNERAEL